MSVAGIAPGDFPAIAPRLSEAELSAMASHLETERDAFWSSCDEAARILARCATRKERRAALGQLASLAHCSAEAVTTRVLLALHFAAEWRAKNVSLPLFIACLKAAKRLDQAPATILRRALDDQLHAKAVRAMGRTTNAPLGLKADCDTCGLNVVCTAEAGTLAKGATLVCPYCGGREGAATILGRLS